MASIAFELKQVILYMSRRHVVSRHVFHMSTAEVRVRFGGRRITLKASALEGTKAAKIRSTQRPFRRTRLMKLSIHRYVPLFFALALVGAHLSACADGDSGRKNQLVDDTTTKDPTDPTPKDLEDTPPDDTTPGEIPVDGNPDDEPNPFEPHDPTVCADGYRFTQWHGPALRQGHAPTNFPLESCAADGVITIMPRGTTWRYTVSDLKQGDTVSVYTAHYFSEERTGTLRAAQVYKVAPASGTVTFNYKGIWGGEQVLVVHTKDPERTGTFKVASTCTGNCGNYTTRFPLVMVHGFLGTQNYFGLFEYWNGILPPIRNAGTEVYDPSSSLVASSESRAIKVAQAIDDALAETGARKVNLIGHSQGGTDSRIIASPGGLDRGANISSLTTIATPHYGVPIPLLEFLSGAINFIFEFPDFSPEKAKAFNNQYVDDPRVEYYSWSFRTCAEIDYLCRIDSGGVLVPAFNPFEGKWGVDVAGGEKVNTLLAIPHGIISIGSFLGGDGADNDGLVSVKSANWGPKANQFGPLWADHVDEIGQIMRDPNSEVFNHVTFYQDWIRQHLIPDGH